MLGKALTTLDASAPEYMEVAMGCCKALAHVDARKCLDQFEVLEQSGRTNSADYAEIAKHLAGADKHQAALDLVDRGLVRFPADDKLAALRLEVQEDQKKPVVTEAEKQVRNIGYATGDE